MIDVVRMEQVDFGYPGRDVLRGLDFAARAGEVVGVCGPNGTGKSTLLRLILGLLRPRSGRVRLGGDLVTALDRRAIAQRAALLMQDSPLELPLTVREVVALGRLPYLRRFETERAADRQAIDAAMEITDTQVLADRRVTELSGGERHRVQLARVLAQDTPLMLLDEPTASFDVAHQLQALRLVRAAAARGRTVLIAMHDLSLAARSCDRILLLGDGRLQADGPPAEALTEENLARLFRVRARVDVDPDGLLRVVPIEPIDEEARR